MIKCILTDDEIRALHIKYLNLKTKSIPAFAKESGINPHTLWRRFKKLNLEIIPQTITKRKFPIDENYFSVINSEEKAYILGFIFADGCNFETNHNVVISLEKGDIDILKRVSKCILFGNDHVKINENKNEARLDLINQKLSDDIKKMGGVARKTLTLTFPDIPKELHPHFIRGYFDGDGMLTFHQRKNSNYKEADFSITSTKEVLSVISDYISSLGVHFGLTKRHKNRDNNNFTIRVSGNQQIKKVCDFLYKDATIYLERKHNLYLELSDLSKKFRVSDQDFILTFNKLKNIEHTAETLNIDRKTVKRRMIKLNLRINE